MSNRFFPNYPSYLVTSPFGPRGSGYHYGIDLVATKDGRTGRTDYITAHTGGVVEECGYNSSAGNFVRIRVSDSTVMSYCHFRDTLPWKKGDIIEKGTALGYMGDTGNSSGAHLHWGVTVNGTWVNPAPWLDADFSDKVPIPVPEEVPKTQTCTVTIPVIRFGDRSETVKIMQVLLDHHGYSCGEYGADGIYGDDTKTALEYFQAEKDLDSDAVCGHDTWTKLLNA